MGFSQTDGKNGTETPAHELDQETSRNLHQKDRTTVHVLAAQ